MVDILTVEVDTQVAVVDSQLAEEDNHRQRGRLAAVGEDTLAAAEEGNRCLDWDT